MNKELNSTKEQNRQVMDKIISRSISLFFIFMPTFSGFSLVWLFLYKIGRPELFQQIAFNTEAIIFIFIACAVFMAAIFYILFIPSWIFVGFSKIVEIDNDLFCFPAIKLIRKSAIAAAFFIISLFSFAYIGFLTENDISVAFAFFPLIIYSIYSVYKLKEKALLKNYKKIINEKSNFYFIKRKIKLISLVFFPALLSILTTSLFLNYAKGGTTLKAFIFIIVICCGLIFMSYLPAIIYYQSNKSLKIFFRFIFTIIITITLVLIILYSQFFNRAFEKFFIIDNNHYHAIFNKSLYSKDIFDDKDWDLKESIKDKDYYILPGEKIFNLSSLTLFCPLGTYQYLKNSVTVDIDKWKPDIDSRELKSYTKSCVVLDTNTTTFKKLEIE